MHRWIAFECGQAEQAITLHFDIGGGQRLPQRIGLGVFAAGARHIFNTGERFTFAGATLIDQHDVAVFTQVAQRAYDASNVAGSLSGAAGKKVHRIGFCAPRQRRQHSYVNGNSLAVLRVAVIFRDGDEGAARNRVNVFDAAIAERNSGVVDRLVGVASRQAQAY